MKMAAVVLALIVVVAVVAVVAMPRDVSVEKEGDGTLSFEGEKSLRAFGSLEIDIQPGEGCFAKVYLDGDEVASDVTSYRYDAPFADFSKHEIKVVFERSAPVPVPDEKVTLTVQAGNGGAVDPVGSKKVAKGSVETLEITPDDGYVIDEMKIDGQNVSVCNILDVKMDGDRTVSVSFRPVSAQDIAVTIDVDAKIEIRTTGGEIDFGKVVPSGEVKVRPGSSLKVSILLNPGFEIEDFKVDGKSVGKVTEYTIENIQKSVDISISVIKNVDGYTIKASAGNGGKISPSGDVKIEKGKDATFAFSANSGYAVSDVTVDGKKVVASGSYTFKAVSENHTISVSFKYVGGGGGGSVTPSKTLTKIEVTKQPTTTEYITGESFDATGMEVTATYSDGSSKVVTDYTCSPTGPLTSSVKSITVSYGGRTYAQTISVYDLESISADATGCRTGYLVGESFDKTGLVVTAKYGSITRTIEDYDYSPKDALTLENKEITITFEGKSCTIGISVVEPTTLTGIEIIAGPAKGHYFDDQPFVKDGMVVSGVYSGGTTIPLDLAKVEVSESDGTVTATYTADSKTYTATCTVTRDLTIDDVSELKHFRDKVNNGTTYTGEIITLGYDIDLNNETWIPIGPNADDDSKKFLGTFDGNSKTISDLKVDLETGYTAAGFFGALGGTVKDLTIDHASIKHISQGNATTNGIAVVAGSLYSSGSIENVAVKNATVEGNRFIGGIAGYVYGNITGCTVESVTLIATPDNLTGEYDNGDKVGGIAGYLGEGSQKITNCSVSDSSISGYRNLGGIAGAAYQAPESCTVQNITILHARDVIAEEPSNGNQSGIIAGTRVGSAAPSSNTVSGKVTTNDAGVLSSACTYAGSSMVTIELMEGTYTPSSTYTKTDSDGKDAGTATDRVIFIGSTKTITIKPADGQTGVIFDGQLKVSGKVTVQGIQMNTVYGTSDVSQFNKSGVAVISEGQFTANDVTFHMTYSDGTAITAYWSLGKGTNIMVTDCIFDCNGQRPIRSDCSVTVENCTFNDQCRYSVQFTSKADTVTGIEKASVVFKNNTINAGSTASGKPVYGVQLEGYDYGCRNLEIEGSGNTIDYGDTGKTGAMYYCDCGQKIDHDSIVWNTEVKPVHEILNYITTVQEFVDFANKVNGGLTNEKTVAMLGANIDLNNMEWTPIGTDSHPFNGTFDGNDYVISNLKISGTQDNLLANNNHGLFGKIVDPALIKNVTIDNASVSGSLYVGVLVGLGFTGMVKDCTVTGDVKIDAWWYAGTINGNGYCNISGCTVDVTEGSRVSSQNGSYIGGIVGFHGEGNNELSNCRSNIDVIGYSYVGGITGIAHYGNIISSCIATCNVTSLVPSTSTDGSDLRGIGGIAGITTDFVGKSTQVIIRNSTFNGTVTSGSGLELIHGGIVGCSRAGEVDQSNLSIVSCYFNGVLVPAPSVEKTIATSDELKDEIKASSDSSKKLNVSDIEVDFSGTTIASDIVISGTGDGSKIKIGGANGNSKNLAYDNVSIVVSNNGTYGNQGTIHSASETYQNSTIEGQLFLYGESVTFSNCTFKQTESGSYNIWTYGAKVVTFENCRFECAGKSVLLYNESMDLVQQVTFNNCKFVASAPADGKSAIEIHTECGATYNVHINNCTTTGFANGSVSGNSLWNEKGGRTSTIYVDGELVWSPTYPSSSS